MRSGRATTFVALGIVYVVWGSTYLAIRVVVEQMPPMSGMGMRFLVAGILLATVVAIRRGVSALRVTRRQLLGAGALGLLLPMLGNGVVAIAESRGATSGYAALLIAMVPLFVIIYRVLYRDRPSPRTVLGVLVGFAGLAVLVTEGRGGTDPIPLGAALLVVLAASFWSFGAYIQPRLTLPRDAFVTTVYEMLIGGSLMVLSGMMMGERFTFHYAAKSWLAWSYLVVIGSVVAYTAFVWLLGNAPISLVATYAYVNPVIAVLLGAVVLSEPLTPAILLGGGIVVGAVGLVISSERPRRSEQDPLGDPAPVLDAA